MNHLASKSSRLTDERNSKYIITIAWTDYPTKQYFASMTHALYRRGMSIDEISERLGIDAGAVETIML